MQDVTNLAISEGDVKTIHDSSNNLLWGKLSYDTKYAGDTFQQTYTGKNLIDFSSVSYSSVNSGSATRNGTAYTVIGNDYDEYGGITFAQSNLKLKTNTTYTASALVVSTTSTSGSVIFCTSSYNTSGSGITSEPGKAGDRISITFTTGASITNSAGIRLFPSMNATTVYDELMIEESSTPTSYEQYVGGIPAPNPDYPQAIQTVTGEQSVWVHGKNMLNPALLIQVEGYNAYNSVTGLWTTTNLGAYYRSIFYDTAGANNKDVSKIVGPLTANTTYTVEFYNFIDNSGSSSNPLAYSLHHSDGTIIGSSTRVNNFFTFTTPNESCYLDIKRVNNTGTVSFSKIMIIKGTYTKQTMPSYEAYQGSIFTVNLGSTELCKLGNYQDYIYKSGSDWYVHKETTKVTYTGSEAGWFYSSTYNRCTRNLPTDMGSTSADYETTTKCNYLLPGDTSGSKNNVYFVGGTSLSFKAIGITDSTDDLKNWLSTHNTTVYYALATPTNTQITDQTLINQLDAIHQFLTRYGYDATVSGNLPLIIDKTNL